MAYSSSSSRLREVLAQLYDKNYDARIVAFDAGLAIEHIDFNGSSIQIWQAILEEAEKQGLLNAIVEMAMKRFPHNPALIAAINDQPIQSSTAPKNPILLRQCFAERLMDEVELRRFCQDHYREVYLNLKETDRWNGIVDRVIRHCEARKELDRLWALLNDTDIH